MGRRSLLFGFVFWLKRKEEGVGRVSVFFYAIRAERCARARERETREKEEEREKRRLRERVPTKRVCSSVALAASSGDPSLSFSSVAALLSLSIARESPALVLSDRQILEHSKRTRRQPDGRHGRGRRTSHQFSTKREEKEKKGRRKIALLSKSSRALGAPPMGREARKECSRQTVARRGALDCRSTERRERESPGRREGEWGEV